MLFPVVPVVAVICSGSCSAATSAPRWSSSRSCSACSGSWARRAGSSASRSALVGTVALFLAATSAERLDRLTNFVDPFQDFQGTGWQAGHGLLGMASGGLFGKGIGASQQKWGNLPEAHTDFIFAVLGEELGLVGTLLVLALFLTIAYAAHPARRHHRRTPSSATSAPAS